MWLKNKTTGQIIEIDTDKWEQCEMKDYWFVDSDGEVEYEPSGSSLDQGRKELGNYFETKEEAEKAAEKLKAWKRLRDAGVKLEIVTIGHKKYLEPTAEDSCTFDEAKKIVEDFEFIFGGKE